jgi:hypothetical protein
MGGLNAIITIVVGNFLFLIYTLFVEANNSNCCLFPGICGSSYQFMRPAQFIAEPADL